MKYIGEFISLNNKQYKVEIITNGISSAETKITLGTDPVIITTESDGLFSPIKSRSCTINIVSDDFYFDMYASAAKQNEVLIYQYKNNDWYIIFEGYVTPGVYDQDWQSLSTIEIECCDKISVLQYFKYQYLDYTGKGEQQVYLFDLLKKCIEVAGYRNISIFYPDKSLINTANSQDIPVLTSATVSEANLFDDDDEHTPWTYEDILTQICQFLGVSCCVHNNMIYLVDYQCVSKYANNVNSYKHATNTQVYGPNNITNVTFTKDNLMGNSPKISLDQTFNKISISCSLYDYASDDEEDLGSKLIDYNNLYNFLGWGYGNAYYDTWEMTTKVISKNYEVTYDCKLKMYSPQSSDYKAGKWKWRFFESNIYDGVPNPEVNDYYDPYKPSNFTKKVEYTDANDIRYCYSELAETMNYQHIYEGFQESNLIIPSAFSYPKKCIYKNIAIPIKYGIYKRGGTSLNYTFNEAIMFTPINRNLNLNDRVHKSWTKAGDPGQAEKFRKYVDDYIKNVLNKVRTENCKPNLVYEDTVDTRYSAHKGNSYLTFYCELLYQCYIYWKESKKKAYSYNCWKDSEGNNYNTLFPVDLMGFDKAPVAFSRQYGNSDFNKGWTMLKLQVSVGDKYWNGTSWQTGECTFEINFHKDMIDVSNPNGDHEDETFNLYSWMKPVYNTDPAMNIDNKNRYVLTITPEDNLFGKLKVVVFTPYIHTSADELFDHGIETHGTWGGGSTTYWVKDMRIDRLPQHIFMKDLEVTYVYSTEDVGSDKEEDDDDIVYTNVINESYVEEFDEIELKINTQRDNKPQSRSYLLNGNDNNNYLHDVNCPATGHSYRPEEHLIEKYYNHYATPKKIFDMQTIFDDSITPATPVVYNSLSDKPLCIDSQEINLADDTNEIKLVEF